MKKFLAIFVLALLTISPACADKLKGNVQKSDQRFRVQRPHTVSIPVSGAATKDSVKAPTLKPTAIFDSNSDFLFNFKEIAPTKAPLFSEDKNLQKARTEADILKAEAENQELVIAWEAWYKRVAGEIFERWTHHSGHIPARCDVVMTFHRDGRIDVSIDNLELALVRRLPGFDPDSLKRVYTQSIENSILPLQHTHFVRFPEKSQRTTVTWPTHFNVVAGGTPSYEWVKNDYERVSANE